MRVIEWTRFGGERVRATVRGATVEAKIDGFSASDGAASYVQDWQRAEARNTELLDIARAVVALWPVVPGRDEPKGMPEVLALWRNAKAAVAKAESFNE